MTRCICGSDHTQTTAVIVPVNAWPLTLRHLTEHQKRFLLENAGKLICYDCCGEVDEEFRSSADHITGSSIVARLIDLGLLTEPQLVN